MEQFLAKYPKLLIAVVVFIVATILIIFNNPLHTVCDVQVANLRTSMEGYMYAKTVGDKRIPSPFAPAKQECQTGASSGACAQYFEILKQLIREIDKTNSECLPKVAEQAAYQGVLRGAIQILTFAAWGPQIPADTDEKMGWLTEVDLATFCRVKSTYQKVYGKAALDSVMTGIFQDLPGESQILEDDPKKPIKVTKAVDLLKKQNKPNIKNEIWKRSLFSLNCEIYR